jgi:hypothetical protein
LRQFGALPQQGDKRLVDFVHETVTHEPSRQIEKVRPEAIQDLGIHRLISQGMTPTNVIGNALAAIVVAKSENALDAAQLETRTRTKCRI